MRVSEINEEDKFGNEILKLIKSLYKGITTDEREMIKYFRDETAHMTLQFLFEQLIEEISVDDEMENLKRVALLQSILHKILFLKVDADVDGMIDRLKAVSNN